MQIAHLLEGRGHVGLVIPPPNAALPRQLSYLPLVTELLVAVVPDNWIADGTLLLLADRLAPDPS